MASIPHSRFSLRTALALAISASLLAGCASSISMRGGGDPNLLGNGEQAPGPGGPGGQWNPLPGAALHRDVALFWGFDADGDKALSRGEFDAGAQKAFASLSPQGEPIGMLDLQTWLISVFGHVDFGYSPMQLDGNLDNSVTRAEFLDFLGKRFAALDANKDDLIARNEFWLRLSRSPMGLGAKGEAEGGPQARPPQTGGRGPG